MLQDYHPSKDAGIKYIVHLIWQRMIYDKNYKSKLIHQILNSHLFMECGILFLLLTHIGVFYNINPVKKLIVKDLNANLDMKTCITVPVYC